MSVVEKIKAEIQVIIDEEIKTLKGIEDRTVGKVQETSERIKNLIQSYSDLEKTLGDLPKLDLMGLTSDTVKVIDWEKQKKNIKIISIPGGGIRLSVAGGWDLFIEHPGGAAFHLDPEKKYKLLVAFIPIEEST